MKHLIELLEKATGPDRKLDVEIGCAIDGINRGHFRKAIDQVGLADETRAWVPSETEWPPYTASLDAALTLVPEGWHWRLDQARNAGAAVIKDDTRIYTVADTPALALCIAALKARETGRTNQGEKL